jgi:predicted O-methyltransferase YrrM
VALDRLPIDGPLAAYLDGLAKVPPDLEALYAEMEGDESAPMMTHPDLGALLEALVRATGGWAVLEIGTFVGTSAAWMARALAPGGRIDTLEADPDRADRAEAFLARAGLADRVRVHRGPALETLPGLPGGAYDLCYIDADKTGYPAYYEAVVPRLRPGGLVVLDNTLLGGRVLAPEGERGRVMADLNERIAADERVDSVLLGLNDGMTLARKRVSGS